MTEISGCVGCGDAIENNQALVCLQCGAGPFCNECHHDHACRCNVGEVDEDAIEQAVIAERKWLDEWLNGPCSHGTMELRKDCPICLMRLDVSLREGRRP